jgi:outer membrane protein OmpA-like peptidoglycan-associated protein
VLYFDAYLNNFTGKNNLIGKNLGTREQYDSLRIILYVAGILNKNPNYRLLVEGFANPTGNDIQAEQDRLVPLSIARANEVADLLTNVLKNAEVDRKRLIVVGEGGLKNSLATNETGQKRNRRAELTIIEPPTPQRSFLLAFESNSTVLTSRNLEALTQDQIKSLQTMVSAVTYLNNNKTHQALIEGYATPEEIAWGGSGKPLSEQRAEEVAAWLIKEKIGPDRITIVRGAGTNTTQERKVEIIMLETNPDVLPEDPLSPNR